MKWWHARQKREKYSANVGADAENSFLSSNRDLTDQISLTSGLSRADYDLLIAPFLRETAALFHSLPASTRYHHTEPGGLLRYALEVGFYSYRASDAKIFAFNAPAEVRRQLEPRWRLACFVAGITHAYSFVFKWRVSAASGEKWDPFSSTLSEWVAVRGEEIKISTAEEFLPEETRQLTAALIGRYLPHSIGTYIAYEPLIVRELLLVAANPTTTVVSSPLKQVVEDSLTAVYDRNYSQTQSHLREKFGLSPELYILDALRRLVRGRWQANSPGSIVWHTAEGCFLVWPKAGDELSELLISEGVNFLPRGADSLAQLMVSKGLLVPNKEDTLPYFWLKPQLKQVPFTWIRMVKLAEREVLFGLEIKGVDAEFSLSKPELLEPEAAIENVANQTDAATAMPRLCLEGEEDDSSASQPVFDLKALQDLGSVGYMLQAFAEDIAKGRIKEGEAFLREARGLSLIYPDTILSYGADPKMVHNKLGEKGWLVEDSGKTLHRKNKKQFIILLPHIADHLLRGHEQSSLENSSSDASEEDEVTQEQTPPAKEHFPTAPSDDPPEFLGPMCKRLAKETRSGAGFFGVVKSGEVVYLPLQQICLYYAGLSKAYTASELQQALEKSGLVVPGDVDDSLTTGKTYIRFDRSLCNELYEAL